MKSLYKMLVVSFFGLFSTAFAGETYRIINNSVSPITAKINNMCSSGFSWGILDPGKDLKFSDDVAAMACDKNFKRCVATAFASRNCTQPIAMVTIDAFKGVVPNSGMLLPDGRAKGFILNANGFVIELMGGSASLI